MSLKTRGSYSFPKELHHYKGSPRVLGLLTPLLVLHHTTVPLPHVASKVLPRVLRVLGVLHWWGGKSGEKLLWNIFYMGCVLKRSINDFFFKLQFSKLQSQRLAQVSLKGRQRFITANCLTWDVGAGRRGCFRRDHLFRNSPDSFRPLYHEGGVGKRKLKQQCHLTKTVFSVSVHFHFYITVW